MQTIGRAARNVDGHVIMYADTITDSMRYAIDEPNRRRAIQQKYNEEHGITPQTIRKAVRELITTSVEDSEAAAGRGMRHGKDPDTLNKKELKKEIDQLTRRMNRAAAELNFELAAELRDEIKELKEALRDFG